MKTLPFVIETDLRQQNTSSSLAVIKTAGKSKNLKSNRYGNNGLRYGFENPQ